MKASKAESDFRWRMNSYILLSQPGQVDIAVNGGIPVITPQLDLADAGNWQLDTLRIQPRTREEENENLALDITFGDEERNIRVGALLNTYSRERLTYSSSVGVTQGTALAPFGYNGQRQSRPIRPRRLQRSRTGELRRALRRPRRLQPLDRQ